MIDEPLSEPADSANDPRAFRAEVLARRASLSNRTARSQAVWTRLAQLSVFAKARTVALYVSVRSEVETHVELAYRLHRGQATAVPFCDGDDLRLCWLRTTAELVESPFGLLEPLPALRAGAAQRVAHVSAMDVVLVPGVVFDRRGGRWGHGRGFYDRLLGSAPATVKKIGLAFECQLVEHLALSAHDVPMDYVVTEAAIYERGI